MLGDIESQGRLPHRGARGQDDQLAFMHAGRHLIQLEKSGGDTLNPFARIQKDIQPALELFNDLPRTCQRIRRPHVP